MSMYWLLILVTLALGMGASGYVKMQFKKYSTTRSSMGLTGAQAAAQMLAAQGIRVNCINPSIIQTPLFNTISVLDEEERETKLKNYPIKRLGLPTDTAWAIIYFLSEASTWVTGNNLKIDGGYTLL